MTGTQAALYAEIDLELSWSESELPQSERTKHVHGLHPYLGKFPPQLAEALIRRHCPEGGLVLDPFCGSGTTLVEAVGLGRDAVGCDISAFNALLSREKTRQHDAAAAAAGLAETLARAESLASEAPGDVPAYLAEWYGEEARRELLAYRGAIEPGRPWSGLASLVLTRAARSARLVRHDALDGARTPVREPYWCHKHRRTCVPTVGALRFLRRYSADIAGRVAAFAALRPEGAEAAVHHLDARDLRLERPADAVVTSPPYVGVIDYHDQHAYAYALLALAPRPHEEIGSRSRGSARARRRRLRRRHGGRADRVRRLPAPRRAARDRRQRPAGPVRRDPRARRPAARVAHAPARQPAHGTPRGRVLRGDPGRARAL